MNTIKKTFSITNYTLDDSLDKNKKAKWSPGPLVKRPFDMVCAIKHDLFTRQKKKTYLELWMKDNSVKKHAFFLMNLIVITIFLIIKHVCRYTVLKDQEWTDSCLTMVKRQ